MTFAYRIELTPDDDGTLLVTSPDLPGVVTFGESPEEARRKAVDAIETMLASMMAHDEDVPEPSADPSATSAVRLPALSALAVALYSALRRSGVSRDELARRLGRGRREVDDLLSFDGTARVQDMEAALAALGEEVDVVVRRAA